MLKINQAWEPINLSQTPLNEDEISLMIKEPSFVPLTNNVDWLDTRIALDKGDLRSNHYLDNFHKSGSLR